MGGRQCCGQGQRDKGPTAGASHAHLPHPASLSTKATGGSETQRLAPRLPPSPCEAGLPPPSHRHGKGRPGSERRPEAGQRLCSFYQEPRPPACEAWDQATVRSGSGGLARGVPASPSRKWR